MVKVNVEMDEATHKAVKIRAIEEGKAMKEYIVEVLKRAIAKGKDEEEKEVGEGEV